MTVIDGMGHTDNSVTQPPAGTVCWSGDSFSYDKAADDAFTEIH